MFLEGDPGHKGMRPGDTIRWFPHRRNQILVMKRGDKTLLWGPSPTSHAERNIFRLKSAEEFAIFCSIAVEMSGGHLRTGEATPCGTPGHKEFYYEITLKDWSARGP